jgi:hypothetical protein
VLKKQKRCVADPDEFLLDPDPDPDLNKFLAKLVLDIFFTKICSKRYIHEPKSQTKNPDPNKKV